MVQGDWQQDLRSEVVCPDCKEDPPNLVENPHTGDTTCANCGIVLAERNIDHSSEWRTFSGDDKNHGDPSRVGDGPNALLNGSQLFTSIAFSDGQRHSELFRAQNKSDLDKSNRGLREAYNHIGALCERWQLPGYVVDAAKHIYKDAAESPLFKGKNRDALIAGCLFLACRRNNAPRSFREVTDLTNVSKKELGKNFKLLETFLRQKEKQGNTTVVSGGTVIFNDAYKGSSQADAGDLCNRYCNRLSMDQSASNVAIAIAKRMTSIGALAGRSPLTCSAACIYMASHLMSQPKLPKDIMAVTKVSDSAFRQAYKLLYNEADTLLTKEIRDLGIKVENMPKP
ncbi:cyclin-like protein [Piedraia hortae CBS 480.64]|uniref:Transcription initiation factor IIB n=1 Tax=Piedraia hortae CBS 480.64 TaxID=1314780 RepID=A0A6A7C154_9PEZI|nr:cyclin-like protein [Piedraia hortae CBS 480.64]